MDDELDQRINRFCELLKAHTAHKAALYDGHNSNRTAQFFMIALAEETGEVASAMVRDRPEAAKAECIDVAHVAFLIWERMGQSC